MRFTRDGFDQVLAGNAESGAEDGFALKNGLTQGRVEYCHNGSFSTFCSDSWDNEDASVVCRQLGFSPYGITISLPQ